VDHVTINYANGDIYEGSIKKRLFTHRYHGYGTFYSPNLGIKIEGEFMDGYIHGWGKYTRMLGDSGKIIEIYEGEFLYSQRNGFGTVARDDGSKIQGIWNGHITQGKKTTPDGKTISILYDSLRDRFFEGDIIDGKLQGYGKMYREGIEEYEGEFKDGLPHGKGTMIYHVGFWENEIEYEGEWKNGLWEGHGTLTFADGRVYVGEFRGSMRHGKGRMIYPDGSVEEGIWLMNEFLGEG